jgi:antitoxin (DNA-binding transcriptional repressor) of toxin-antitoxin stability system
METHLSDIIAEVINGEEFRILAGGSNEPVAMIVPVRNRKKPRKIGVLDGKASFKTDGNGKL